MKKGIDRLKDRWVLIKHHRGKIFYYRGAKKYPTEEFVLAYSYPSKKVAENNRNFMYSGGKYRVIPADEKLLFKLKLQGVK